MAVIDNDRLPGYQAHPRTSRSRPFALALLGAACVAFSSTNRVDVLRPVGGLPAHVAGRFTQPLGFQQTRAGDYFVFDRREHSVYRVGRDEAEATRIVRVGHEAGRILQPHAFDAEPGGSFVVADGPTQRERIQIFNAAGERLGGFTLPGRHTPRVVADGLVLSGVGSLDYTGRSILVNQPERDALVTLYGLAGTAYRTFGSLRPTGQESNRDVHLGLNTGIPIADPTGGYYFVFRTGVPLFRKYSQDGELLFERHIEGPELDATLRRLPTSWPRSGGTAIPLIPPNVRAAAVDADGNLWVALVRPYTYVYDRDGEKSRVVQFRSTDLITPDSLSFAPDGRLLVTPGCYAFAP